MFFKLFFRTQLWASRTTLAPPRILSGYNFFCNFFFAAKLAVWGLADHKFSLFSTRFDKFVLYVL